MIQDHIQQNSNHQGGKVATSYNCVLHICVFTCSGSKSVASTYFLLVCSTMEGKKKKREIIFHNIHQSKCDSFSCHLYLFDFVCLFVLVLSVLMRSVVAELSFHVWKFKLFWDSSPKKTTCIFITWN